MRIVFMGTPPFAVPALESLHKAGLEVVAAYSQPPRPKNRGHEVTKSPVHEKAEALGIDVFTPATFKDEAAREVFFSHKADLAVVVAYGLILRKDILNSPRLGCINIHGSILPRWRGAAPIHRAMLAGDRMTGITIMQMDEGLDTGPMLSQAEYPLDASMSFQEVHDAMSILGAELLIKTLPDYSTGKIVPETQPEQGVTYAKKLTKEEGHLDFTKSSLDIVRQVNTLNPWPGTYTHYQGQTLKIHAVSMTSQPLPTQISAGTLLEEGFVACGDGVISLDILQRSGGKSLGKNDFLRGFELKAGEVFS